LGLNKGEIMWEWMVLTLKVTIGTFLWVLIFSVIFFIVGGIAYAIKPKPKKKPKWNGQPIVVKGGKKKDES
jgi:predicted membrane channel-forming protein YqfA (hemolysin III family)